MAYGTEAEVTLLIGGADTTTFTAGSTGNIVAAIAISDTWVDSINSAAAAADKTLASNLIAKNILLNGRITKMLKGLNSDGGNATRPSRSAAMHELIPKVVYRILTRTRAPRAFYQQDTEAGDY